MTGSEWARGESRSRQDRGRYKKKHWKKEQQVAGQAATGIIDDVRKGS